MIVTMSGYLILTSTDFTILIFHLLLTVLVEKIYMTCIKHSRLPDHISKHLKVSQKYQLHIQGSLKVQSGHLG